MMSQGQKPGETVPSLKDTVSKRIPKALLGERSNSRPL